MIATTELLARLEGVRGDTARCPAHDDERNSLSVGEGDDGRVLLHCHAGCAFEEIIAALDLEPQDLFPEQHGNGSGGFNIEATYDYEDETGELLYQIVRLRPKDFRQRRPDGRDGWIWNVRGVRRVLYRLPDVVEAVALGKPIHIVEGEKDVERLVQLGLTATTAAGGAQKWRSEYAASLKGARVVIIPDNDEPGRAHAEDIARCLHEVTAAVRVVELPGLSEKGDVSDWLDAGGIPEELARLVEAAATWEPAEADPTPEDDLEDALAKLEVAPTLEGMRSLIPLILPLDPLASDLAVERFHQAVKDLGIRKGTIREAVEEESNRQALVQMAAAHERASAPDPPDPEVEAEAEKLLERPDILDEMVDATTRLGHRGEDVNRKVVLLAGVAGHTARDHRQAIHLVLKGDSAGGKNELARRVLGLLPGDRVHFLTGVSRQGLVYAGGRLEGVLVFQEADGEEDAEYVVRQAMSEGWLERLTVQDGQAQLVRTYVAGSIVTTTTSVALHDENQTRVFDLHVDTSEELTREVVKAVAEQYAGGGPDPGEKDRIRQVWRTAFGALEPAEVVVPFAAVIGDAFPTQQVRARRDIGRTLNLIRTCAVLHQRSRKRDGDGRIVATVADYRMVYPLLQEILAPSMSGYTEAAIALSGIQAELAREAEEGWVARVDLQQEAERRNIASATTVRRWCRKFVNRGAWDARKPAGRWEHRIIRDVSAEPVPLPKPEHVAEGARGADGCQPAVAPSEARHDSTSPGGCQRASGTGGGERKGALPPLSEDGGAADGIPALWLTRPEKAGDLGCHPGMASPGSSGGGDLDLPTGAEA